MKRIVPLPLLALFFCLIPFNSANAAGDRLVVPMNIQPQTTGPAERMYFHSSSGDVEQLLVLRKRLISLGARHVNCFVPFTVVAEVPVEADYLPLLAGTDITSLREPDIEMGGGASYVYGPRWVKQCYQTMERLREEKKPELLNSIPHDDYILPPDRTNSRPRSPIAVTSSPRVARKMSQNSEYLAGDILINVIYPESQGNNENWTAGMLSAASSAALFGSLYFQETFTYARIDFIFNNFTRKLTTVEPIEYSRFEDKYWVTNVMNNMGYDGTVAEYKNLVHQFNEQWREHYGTDWVYTCFVVNSANDPDHLFRDARSKVGVGYPGGPYFAAPYPASWGGGAAFTQAFVMETCKMFWALNEDPGTEALCTDRSGYLNYKNWNKTKAYGLMNAKEGCATTFYPELCTMNTQDMFDWFWDGEPCYYTLGMIGLIDLNTNNVPDAVDAPPIVEFTPAERETLFDDEFLLDFRAVSLGVPNRNPKIPVEDRITYAMPVKDVNYWVNGAGPMSLQPNDGASDETTEEFTAALHDLIPGLTNIEVISRNILGATSNIFVKHLYYMGLSYQHFSFQFSNEGIQIMWDILGETFDAKFDLHRVVNSPVPHDSVIIDSIPYVPSGDYFTRFCCFDPAVQPGRRYTYYVEGSFKTMYRGSELTITKRSNEFEVIASLNITKGRLMSPPSPNPFRDEMWVSIDVPATYREAGSAASTPGGYTGRASAVQEPIPTWVKVTIYDATGRRVKDLYHDRIYSTVRTIRWDGSNNNNEQVPSGVYFLRAEAGPLTQTQKVMILR